jgi:hypothetical protein
MKRKVNNRIKQVHSRDRLRKLCSKDNNEISTVYELYTFIERVNIYCLL